MVEENRWDKSLIGLVLFGLNIFWMASLVLDMFWNICVDGYKDMCVSWCGDDTQPVSVETLEHAKVSIAQRDATIGQRDETIEELRATIKELRASIKDDADTRTTERARP